MTSFVVQVSGPLPWNVLEQDGSVTRQTVLEATVRDQAALHGYLTVLHDLGLDLLDLRRIERSVDHGPGSLPGEPAPEGIEVVIRGPIGEFALSELSDHVEVTDLATRLVLSDRRLLDQVLEWVRTSDAVVEFAADGTR